MCGICHSYLRPYPVSTICNPEWSTLIRWENRDRESFIDLKYFHDVAYLILCNKEPACGFHALKGPIIGSGSLWHKRAGGATS